MVIAIASHFMRCQMKMIYANACIQFIRIFFNFSFFILSQDCSLRWQKCLIIILFRPNKIWLNVNGMTIDTNCSPHRSWIAQCDTDIAVVARSTTNARVWVGAMRHQLNDKYLKAYTLSTTQVVNLLIIFAFCFAPLRIVAARRSQRYNRCHRLYPFRVDASIARGS